VSAADSASIADGSHVSLHFSLKLKGDEEVLQTNQDREPLTYVHGDGSLLPALEEALLGKKQDDRVELMLDADQAYGPINAELFREVPADQIPEEARAVGALLSAPDYEGPIRVSEVRDEVVVLDFNHPLAGEDLQFDITIISVNAKPPESGNE
jgi:FKBP-type peptidyl-prolyl cis-trans isomerase 2